MLKRCCFDIFIQKEKRIMETWSEFMKEALLQKVVGYILIMLFL